MWKTEDVRQNRKGRYWLNTLVKKEKLREERYGEQGMDCAYKTESIEDLINTLKDPQQRKHAMELLNNLLEAYNEKTDLEESIAELDRELKRLKDEKEKMLGADNN